MHFAVSSVDLKGAQNPNVNQFIRPYYIRFVIETPMLYGCVVVLHIGWSVK
jgi:hypothetical protein